MKPSDEAIEKFRRVYFEEFGEEISREEAYEKFLRSVNLLRVILKPIVKRGQEVKNPDPVMFDEDIGNDKLKKYYH